MEQMQWKRPYLVEYLKHLSIVMSNLHDQFIYNKFMFL